MSVLLAHLFISSSGYINDMKEYVGTALSPSYPHHDPHHIPIPTIIIIISSSRRSSSSSRRSSIVVPHLFISSSGYINDMKKDVGTALSPSYPHHDPHPHHHHQQQQHQQQHQQHQQQEEDECIIGSPFH
ncbi:hypothetical protein EBH_0046510 [Eimeria brunetti]|uniref:Uncharacterized protein n=1 Tax=Eimeria brunetti TaxID=51314 RepID=U6LTY7_9EIME|nr:hypothetical protein EBH_0046510 [Eimeria brunetti]